MAVVMRERKSTFVYDSDHSDKYEAAELRRSSMATKRASLDSRDSYFLSMHNNDSIVSSGVNRSRGSLNRINSLSKSKEVKDTEKQWQHQRKVNELSLQLNQLEKKVSTLKSENENLKKQSEDQRGLDEKLKVLRKRNADLSHTVKKFEEAAKKNHKAREPTLIADTNIKKNNKKQQNTAKQPQQNQHDNATMQQFHAKYQQLINHINSINTQQHLEMESSEGSLEHVIRVANKERLVLEKENERLTEELELRGQRCGVLEGQVEALKQADNEKDKMEVEVMEGKINLESLEQIVRQYKDSLSKMEFEMLEMKEHNTSLSASNNHLSTQMQAAEKTKEEKARLLAELESQQSDHMELTATLAQLNSSLDAAKTHNVTLNNLLLDWQERAAASEQEASTLGKLMQEDSQTNALESKSLERINKDFERRLKLVEEREEALEKENKHLKEALRRQENNDNDNDGDNDDNNNIKSVRKGRNIDEVDDDGEEEGEDGEDGDDGEEEGEDENTVYESNTDLLKKKSVNLKENKINGKRPKNRFPKSNENSFKHNTNNLKTNDDNNNNNNNKGVCLNGIEVLDRILNTKSPRDEILDKGISDEVVGRDEDGGEKVEGMVGDEVAEVIVSDDEGVVAEINVDGKLHFKEVERVGVSGKVGFRKKEHADSIADQEVDDRFSDGDVIEGNGVHPQSYQHLQEQEDVHIFQALYHYNPCEYSPNLEPSEELYLSEGDYVIVYGGMDEDGFYFGENMEGVRGYIPSNFVRKLSEAEKEDFYKMVSMATPHSINNMPDIMVDESPPSTMKEDLNFISLLNNRHDHLKDPNSLEDLPEAPIGLNVEVDDDSKSLLITWLPVTLAGGLSGGMVVMGYCVYLDGVEVNVVQGASEDHLRLTGLDDQFLSSAHIITLTTISPNHIESKQSPPFFLNHINKPTTTTTTTNTTTTTINTNANTTTTTTNPLSTTEFPTTTKHPTTNTTTDTILSSELKASGFNDLNNNSGDLHVNKLNVFSEDHGKGDNNTNVNPANTPSSGVSNGQQVINNNEVTDDEINDEDALGNSTHFINAKTQKHAFNTSTPVISIRNDTKPTLNSLAKVTHMDKDFDYNDDDDDNYISDNDDDDVSDNDEADLRTVHHTYHTVADDDNADDDDDDDDNKSGGYDNDVGDDVNCGGHDNDDEHILDELQQASWKVFPSNEEPRNFTKLKHIQAAHKLPHKQQHKQPHKQQHKLPYKPLHKQQPNKPHKQSHKQQHKHQQQLDNTHLQYLQQQQLLHRSVSVNDVDPCTNQKEELFHSDLLPTFHPSLYHHSDVTNSNFKFINLAASNPSVIYDKNNFKRVGDGDLSSTSLDSLACYNDEEGSGDEVDEYNAEEEEEDFNQNDQTQTTKPSHLTFNNKIPSNFTNTTTTKQHSHTHQAYSHHQHNHQAFSHHQHTHPHYTNPPYTHPSILLTNNTMLTPLNINDRVSDSELIDYEDEEGDSLFENLRHDDNDGPHHQYTSHPNSNVLQNDLISHPNNLVNHHSDPNNEHSKVLQTDLHNDLINGANNEDHVRVFMALFSYNPSTMSPNTDADDVELTFKEGQVIKIFGNKDEDGFFMGEVGGLRGLVPCNMVCEVQVKNPAVVKHLMMESSRVLSASMLSAVSSSVQPSLMAGDDVGDVSDDGDGAGGGDDDDDDGEEEYEDGEGADRSEYFEKAVEPYKMVLMTALYDYNPVEHSPNDDIEHELSFRKGDVMEVAGEIDADGFYCAQLNGEVGMVPSNFITLCEHHHQDEDSPHSHLHPHHESSHHSLQHHLSPSHTQTYYPNSDV